MRDSDRSSLKILLHGIYSQADTLKDLEKVVNEITEVERDVFDDVFGSKDWRGEE